MYSLYIANAICAGFNWHKAGREKVVLSDVKFVKTINEYDLSFEAKNVLYQAWYKGFDDFKNV